MIKLLGDPHIGKKFNNVNLHRRGEREKDILEKFKENLLDLKGYKYHICLGDLFDYPLVSLEELLYVYEVYSKAIGDYEDVEFYVLAGNHDLWKTREKYSSFDILSILLKTVDKIRFVRNDPLYVHSLESLLVPYDHHESFLDKLSKFFDTNTESHYPHTIYCHHDLADFDPNVLNKFGIKKIYNGHIHRREKLYIDNIEVNLIGSMLPYAHDQDDSGQYYVTLTLDNLKSKIGTDELRNKHVRVLLKPDQELDIDVDCISLTVKKEVEKPSKLLNIKDIENMNIPDILTEILKKNNVSDSKIKEVLDEWSNHYSSM